MTSRLAISVFTMEGASIPYQATPGSAGLDLHSNQELTIAPGEVGMIPTGLKLAIPTGYEVQVRPRSGLSTKKKLIMPNSIGTIDSDYRGQVFVPLMNLSKVPVLIPKGERVAQMVVASYLLPDFNLVSQEEDLGDTIRGEGGFGHSG
jgi:dUTP pyrophosphatase